MSSPLSRGARGLVFVLVLAAACDAGSTPPPPAAKASPSPAAKPSSSPATSAPAAQRNLLMGTGEPRNPQPFTLEQRLLDAVRRNDRPTIERALELGATVAAEDDLHRSTVLLAVLDAQSLELVRWLHDKGAALDEPDVSGRAALSFAAATGQLDVVRYLVDNGAEIDRRDVQQRTPLFHAALGDHRDVVALLLDHGADPNVRDQFGDTPLIVACAKGNGATAALLLERGADPSSKDQEGRTAAQRAAPGTAPCLAPPTAAP